MPSPSFNDLLAAFEKGAKAASRNGSGKKRKIRSTENGASGDAKSAKPAKEARLHETATSSSSSFVPAVTSSSGKPGEQEGIQGGSAACDGKNVYDFDICYSRSSFPPFPELTSQDIVLLCKAKDEATLLPSYLNHYKMLGVTALVLLDNNSGDNTKELARQLCDLLGLKLIIFVSCKGAFALCSHDKFVVCWPD